MCVVNIGYVSLTVYIDGVCRALRRHHLIGGGAPTWKVGVGGAKMKSAAAAFGGACGLVLSQIILSI